MTQDDEQKGRPRDEMLDDEPRQVVDQPPKDDVPSAGSDGAASPIGDPDEADARVSRVSYDPLKEYDPQVEFNFLEQQRNSVDAKLATITSPFISKILHIYTISAAIMIWVAVIMPFLAWIGWPLNALPNYALIGLIVGPPLILLVGLFVWRLLHVRIRLKWARVDLERYVADKVALRLKEDNGRWSGAIDGMGTNSEMALLELLRIRPRAFHIWHRISVHPIMMSIQLRGPLETKMISPRFFAMVLPIMTILFFLAYHSGAVRPEAPDAGASFWAGAQTWLASFWTQISHPRVSLGWGVQIPLFVIFLIGFTLAFRAFQNAMSTHAYIMTKIGKTLRSANQLTPFSHDCSKAILHKHHLLLRLFTRMMWYGRSQGGGSVRDMFEDLRADLGEIGMDFELSGSKSMPAPGTSADGNSERPLFRLGERRS